MSGTMLMLMTGCGGWQDGKDLAQAKERTRDDAWQQTRDVQRMIDYDHADRADLFIRSAGRVKGVEVMQVSGSTPDTGDGVVLVIRVHGRTPIVDSWNRRTGEQLVLQHCFRLVYDRTVRDEPVGAAHPADLVECPTTAPLSIPASPELPAGAR
ncbi:hypothetical protein [Micromonospora sp. RTP1Z1]|uniref:hypothetical protein n=1 Tax=Micromonospora sp. RTP1Z1 TaxID=2994043 RepID=UPI0029C8CE55|nr:hypothetical protein [Micromonospora sp. RTP1Z1]